MSEYAKREAINRVQERIAVMNTYPTNSGDVSAHANEINTLRGVACEVSQTTTPATGTCACQFVFKDHEGAAIANAVAGIAYASSTNGLDVTAVTSFAKLTNGDCIPLSATKCFAFVTEADGKLGITLTASAATYYITFVMPNGKLYTSGALVVN